MYCLIVLSFLLLRLMNAKKSEQYLICYIGPYNGDLQQLRLHMDFTLREGHWIHFLWSFITDIPI
jgi:hypothetical protein